MADSSFAVLNLGTQRVSGAVFQKSKSGELVLKQAEFVEMLGDPSVEAARLPQLRVALQELSGRLNLKGKSVWYSIAGHVVFTRFVKLPPFDASKADQIVEFEARQNVPFPINEVVWDYEFVGDESSVEREVALVAIKSDALSDINEQVENTGGKVEGVDIAPLAVYNAFRYSYPDVAVPALIIDLGARSSNLIFVEGGKVFTRNILVGGSSLTSAISKEMGLAFPEAENQKRRVGYIAPGGAYEPHPDENIDAISKIMRNSMIRLHGEIVRTINYYRSQQGGTPPQQIFLCGGGAQTAMIADFFMEKFNLPVEILNPLRGVKVDLSVNQSILADNTPSLAELVGLGLRSSGSVPVEVALIPESVTQARETAKKVPFFALSALSLFAAIGLGGFYYSKAASILDSKLAATQAEHSNLQNFDSKINKLNKDLEGLVAQSAQLEQAVTDRGYWKNLLAYMNNKFQNDYVWLTKMQVVRAKPPVEVTSSRARGGRNSRQKEVAAAPAFDPEQYHLEVEGLYRKNDSGIQVVYNYYNNLIKEPEFFTPPPPNEKPEGDSGTVEERYAYTFKFKLPLVKGMKFEN